YKEKEVEDVEGYYTKDTIKGELEIIIDEGIQQIKVNKELEQEE
ncbi:18028_t:CDS:2, partial [Acaulospora morrowiae]